MSGKKQKAVAGWYDCSKCKKRFSRQLLTKHVGDEEQACRAVYPYLKNNTLFCLLSNVTTATRKIGELPFVKDKRLASSTLFLSEELIKECGFTTFGWVSLTPVTAHYERDGDECKEDPYRALVTSTELDTLNSNYAFRVWPIPESIGSNQCSLQAVMCTDGFTMNQLIPSNPKTDVSGGDTPCGLVGVQNLIPAVGSAYHDVFPSATEITLVINNFNEIDQTSFDIDRFTKTFKRMFQGRPIAVFNRFKIRFYSQLVHFYAYKIQSTPICDSKTEIDVECLGLEHLSIQENVTTFQQIVASTVVHVVTKDSLNLTDKCGTLNSQITLKDIGGLSSVMSEICSTVKFILNTELDVPKGILIHGHMGVGKSYVAQAIANEFNLFQNHYEEFSRSTFSVKSNESSSTSLDKIFKNAISRSPSVIIVDGLDVISPRKKSDTGAAPITQVTAQFLKMSSSNQVKRSKILILCTATDLDRVDPSIRSPKIFAKEIEIPIPTAPEREEILHKMLQHMNHNLSEEDIKHIASNTHGFVAADLRSLCNQATLDVITKQRDTSGTTGHQTDAMTIRNMEECMKSVKPSAIKSILIDIPNVKWSDIGGQDELKFKLKQAIEWPLKHPESFRRLGITPPKGILMYGPPGCSKTMIAKAIATESGLNFISVKGSELFSKWVGESEKAVQAIFRKARQVAPCVIFFDEIDSLGGERGTSSGSSNVHERVLAQILVEIDGIEALKDVTIVAATNRPDRIDQALLRPGRLDRIIYVPLPDDNTRREILKLRYRKMPVESQVIVNIDELVKMTDGYSGAELTAVCHEAALKALEEDITCTVIQRQHFDMALSLVKPRITEEQIKFYKSYSINKKSL